MIVGNNVAGRQREIGLWDDVTVASDLRVDANIDVSGPRRDCEWVNGWYSHTVNVEIICPNGKFAVGIRTGWNATYVDVYPYSVYCCKIGN